jgi:hypothetical protein
LNESYSSIISKKKKLPVQGLIIGALLMSIVWLAATFNTSLTPLALAQSAATCEGEAATIVGTAGDDNLVGTPGDDVIAGLGGNDRIDGLGGNDRICGGDGDDRIDGGDDADVVFGNAGTDALLGGDDNDFLNGGTGTDSGDGGPGFNACVNLETETNCQA